MYSLFTTLEELRPLNNLLKHMRCSQDTIESVLDQKQFRMNIYVQYKHTHWQTRKVQTK